MDFTKSRETAKDQSARRRHGFLPQRLHLILDEKWDSFVSYNSAGQGETSPRTILFGAFLDRYFPFTPPAGEKK